MRLTGILAGAAALAALAGCQMATGANAGDARAVQNWSLWEPLDSFNTSVWNKANWTNGGMFNAGFVPGNVAF